MNFFLKNIFCQKLKQCHHLANFHQKKDCPSHYTILFFMFRVPPPIPPIGACSNVYHIQHGIQLFLIATHK
jgi:hypothetical protein